MHATGYLETRSRHPVALIAAISLNLVAVGGMLAYTTNVIRRDPGGIPLIPIPKDPDFVKPLDPPKTPLSRSADPQPRPIPTQTPPTTTEIPTETTFTWPENPPLPPIPMGEDAGSKPVPAPVEVGARVDTRYAGDLQPPYPPALERLEIEGTVTVRAQVGTDGRVTAVELVRADNPGFFTATRDQALRRWRFRPATRDGQPYVSWVTKTVVFKMPGR